MVGSKAEGRTRAGAAPADAARPAVGTPPHEYFPGLDGLRAIAVVAVVVFHAGVAGAPGGFLGVSMFFTLSGFLITGLLISESAASGRISLRRFWGRRVRRLMPAALLCLGLVLAGSRWLATRAALPRLRVDVIAAATNVANWRFITARQSYAELFAHQSSAVLHFWSLAIEEQFYLIFPCIVAVLVGRRRALALPLGLAAMTVASVIASVLTNSHDTIYYGTHTRAAELLIGGLLACAVHRHTRVWPASPRPMSARLIQLTGFIGLGAFVALVVVTGQGDGWLYRGGFAALALLWCALIVAARSPGPFRALVSRRPLVALGRRSYGVYLFHWPVFTLLTADRLGVHGWRARVIQLVVIAAVTESSYRLVERPIRQRTVLSDTRRAPATALACVTAVIAAALVLPVATAGSAGPQLNMVDAPDEVVHLAPPAETTAATGAGIDPGTDIPERNVVGLSSHVPRADPPAAPAPPATSATPALNVVVVGGVPAVASRVRSFRAGGRNIDVSDLTADGCTIVAVTAGSVGDGSCTRTSADSAVDVLVVGVGRADHQAIAEAMAVAPGEPGAEVFSVVQTIQQGAVAAFESLGHRAPKVVVVDTVGSEQASGVTPADVLDSIIAEAVLSTPSLKRVGLADLQPATIDAPAAPTSLDAAPIKVMVIGDSTSYGVAEGLAGSPTAPFDVLWAGKRNCPIARMESIRWPTGNEFSMADCPSVGSVWPDQLASFRPDVVLVVDGLPEESMQRYAGDPDWHQAGDPQFVAVHSADFGALVDLVAETGSMLILADQPHNADGGVAWSTTERIDAWNAQLAAWDAEWASVATMPYGEAVESAEAAAGHSLRPDGLHLDDASVATIVGGTLAPALRNQVVDLRTALSSSGCLTGVGAATTLDLTHCR